MRIVTLLVLTALINGTFLTGCAGLRVQHHTCFQPPTFNQRADPLWEAVIAVPVDSSLHVELGTGDLIRGRFYSADEQRLNLVQGRNARSVPRVNIHSVPRTEIRRVLLVRGVHAKKGALWGLGIGAASGVGAWISIYDSDLEAILFPLTLSGIGTGIGAFLGAIIPNREVIYEAPGSGAGKDQGQVSK